MAAKVGPVDLAAPLFLLVREAFNTHVSTTYLLLNSRRILEVDRFCRDARRGRVPSGVVGGQLRRTKPSELSG
jgi:hypothetical protein